jgi:cobalamin transport system substrate-binding protein
MKRIYLLITLVVLVAACSPADTGSTTTTQAATSSVPGGDTTTTAPTTTSPSSTTSPEDGFPVTVEDDNGSVTIDARPDRIVSLSTVATEMLFAVGAGDQVVAVDDQSNFPAEAPMTELSGFTPNVEAILGYQPDLVVVSYDPGDLVASLSAADVPVLSLSAAITVDDVYRQIDVIGSVTGHHDDAVVLNDSIATQLATVVEEAPELPEGTSYYHEIDNNLYTITSSTFFGQIYEMFGLVNIADEADPDGFGYPQLSSEFVVASDPSLIFLADALYGESAESVATRPGWGEMAAVREGNVVTLDSDIASRWGPRIVDFAESVSSALVGYVSQG